MAASRVAAVHPSRPVDESRPVDDADLVGGGETLAVPVRLLDPGVGLPVRAHPGDAGADLVTTVDVELGPGERATVPTGVALAVPPGWAAMIHPRSGLAAHHGVTIVNAPGTVDAGYRGEVAVTLLNTDRSAVVRLARGERIAQVVLQRVAAVTFVEVEDLGPSERGTGGHGSTGSGPMTVQGPTTPPPASPPGPGGGPSRERMDP